MNDELISQLFECVHKGSSMRHFHFRYLLITTIVLLFALNVTAQGDPVDPTPTPTETPTLIPTETPTVTPTETPIPSPTETPTVTPTETPLPTMTFTPTETVEPTTVAETATATDITGTPVASPTETLLPTMTHTLTQTSTATTQVVTCSYTISAGDVSGLVAAINSANSIMGPDTICLTPNSIYTLVTDTGSTGNGKSAFPLISTEITILGNNSTFIQATTAAFRQFEVTSAGTFTLKDVTISGAQNTYSPIFNSGRTTLNNITFTDNWGAVKTTGSASTLTITNIAVAAGSRGRAVQIEGGTNSISNSTFSNLNGGAIGKTAGSLSVDSSIFLSNSSPNGGAIDSSGGLTVTNSIFDGNSATTNGGAIRQTAGTTSISSSIFRNNRVNDPQYGSGGAIYGGSQLTVTGNCIYGNTRAQTPNGIAGSSVPASLANNWWGSPDGPNTDLSDTASANFTPFLTTPILGCPPTPITAIDQSLVLNANTPINITLSRKGGMPAFTYTVDTPPAHGVLSGTAPNFVYTPNTDFSGNDLFTFTVTDSFGQTSSGTVRLYTGVPIPANIIVNSTAQENPFVTNGSCTLGEAIQAANTNVAVDTCAAGYAFATDVISLSPGTYALISVQNTGTEGANGFPIVIQPLVIHGNNATITRSGSAAFRFFQVTNQGSLTLDNLTFSNGQTISASGQSAGGGGAIYSAGPLTLTNTIFASNLAPQTSAGAVGVSGGPLTITGSTFSNNSALGGSGAISVYSSLATSITNSTFTNNKVTTTSGSGSGGAIHLNSPATITGSTFTGNQALTGGAIIAETSYTLTISNTVFDSNSAQSYGGAIYLKWGTANITQSTFKNNVSLFTSTGAGAAIETRHNDTTFAGGIVNISNSCLVGNGLLSLNNASGNAFDARNNWWGRFDGPTTGTRATSLPVTTEYISSTITYAPFMTTPPAGCAVLPPVAVNQSLTTVYRTAKNITLTATGGLPPYTFAAVTNPANGTLTGIAPNLTYTPNANFTGTDTFTFRATNSNGESATGTISISINSDIKATNQTVTAQYDSAGIPVALTATGGWPPYTFTTLTNPLHGTLSGTVPNLIYTPNALYFGPDSFTYKVSDESNFNSIGTITLNVTWPLDAQDQTLHTPNNTPVSFTLNANSDQLPNTFTVVSTPASGTLTGVAPTLTYTPNTGFSGLETISFKVTDTEGFTDTGTVKINVAPALVVADQFLYTQGTSPKSLYVQPTGGRHPYSYAISTQPTNGTLTGTLPSLSYVFNTGFTGLDSFNVTIADANSTQVSVQVKISNGAVLTATDGSLFTPYQTDTVLPLAAVGGIPPYTFNVLPPLTHGVVSGGTPDWIYTPNTGYSGVDYLSYSVTDSVGYQNEAIIAVTVGNPLTLNAQSLTTQFETPLVISTAASGGLGTYTYTHTMPTHGTLSGTDPDLIYWPNNGYSGSDSFNVTVTDTLGNTRTTLISINVPAPTIVAAGDVAGLIAAISAANISSGADTIILSQSTYTLTSVYSGTSDNSIGLPTLSGTLAIRGNGATITRADSAPWFRIFKINAQAVITIDNLTISKGYLSSTGAGAGIYNGGNLTLLNSKILNNTTGTGAGIYTSKPGTLLIVGSSIIQNQASSAGGGVYSTGSITVTNSIIANNSTAFRIGENTSIGVPGTSGNVTGSCITGNGHTSVGNSNSSGTLNFQNNWWGSTSGPSLSGQTPYVGDSTSSKVNTDGFLTAPILGCPLAVDQTVNTALNHALTMTLQGSYGVAPYSFSILTNPTNGSLTGTAPNITYAPNAGFSGTDKLAFRLIDANGVAATGLVTINVAPQLVATSTTFGAPLNTAISIGLGATGGRAPYTFGNTSTPTNGTLTGTAPNLTYTPNTDFEGNDTFTFDVTDANGAAATGTVTVVTGPLVAQSQSLNTAFNTNKDITLNALGGAMPYTFIITTPPQHGYLVGTPPNATYSPVHPYSGTDTFEFTVQDQLGNTDTATVTIAVASGPSSTIVVTSFASESPQINNGNCTLNEAIQAANSDTVVDACPAGSGADIIEIPAGTLETTGDGFSGIDFVMFAFTPITSPVTIRGAGMNQTIIHRPDSSAGKSFFYINQTNAVIEGLSLQNGRLSGRPGAAVYSYRSTTKIREITFKNNYSSFNGSAIVNREGSLTIQNSAFLNNIDDSAGAAVYDLLGTSLEITNSAFNGNRTFDLPNGSLDTITNTNVILRNNCILEAQPSIVNRSSTQLDARFNWWGGFTGTIPNVTIEPRLNVRPSICDLIGPATITVAAGDTAGLIAALQFADALHTPTTVDLAPGSTYTMTQAFSGLYASEGMSAFPQLIGNVIINGNGATLTKDVNATFRFFNISGGSLTLRNLTLSNGRGIEGAAIRSYQSSLTLQNVTLLNNLHLQTDYPSGGAIYAWGSTEATSHLTVQGSTFDGNTSSSGGGISSFNTTLSVTSSVFTHNSASLGSSIAVIRGSAVNIQNNCFVYNANPSFSSDPSNNSATKITAANNWWGANNGPSGPGQGAGDAVDNNIIYSPFLTTKPVYCPTGPVIAANQTLSIPYYRTSLLITLSASGGVPNYTFAVTTQPEHGTLAGVLPNLSYSPNEGYIGDDSFSFLVTDTNGLTANGSVVITVNATDINVNTVAQEVPFVTNGNCSLGEAIQAANTDTTVDACPAGNGDDIIRLATGTYTLTQPDNSVLGATGLPAITSAISIDGNDAIIERSAAAGTPDFRPFYVSAAGTLELHNLTVQNGRLKAQNFDTDRGGAIFSSGGLILDNVTISGNSVSYYGGGLYVDVNNAQLQISNSTIKDNEAGTGGGLWVCRETTINSSVFQNNSANSGGGIYNSCYTVTISDANFLANHASVGGGLANRGAGEHFVINRSIFDQNTAGNGSSVANNYTSSGSTVSITDSCLLDHTSSSVYDALWYGGVTALSNWWGSSTGPSGISSGYGSGISGQNVKFTPFLVEPILGCGHFAPSAFDQTLVTGYGISKDVTLSGVDGLAPYSFTILTQPTSGTLSGNAPNLTFTPSDGFSGQTSFSYQVKDANNASDAAVITIQVKPQLIAQSPNITTKYQTSINVNLGASGGQAPYTFSVITQPEHGTLTGNPPNLTYQPDNAYGGLDSFDYQVTDVNGSVANGTVTIDVGLPLKGIDRDLTTFQNTSLTFSLTATGGSVPYSFTVLTQPANGILYKVGQQYTYIPRNGYSGFDSLTFSVTDAKAATATGTINVAVNSTGTNAPANLSIVNTARPTFSWSTFGGAAQYHLQADTDDSFDAPSVDVLVSSTSYTIPNTKSELDQGKYHWRVAAVKGAQEIWSGAPEFVVFLGTTPANNAFSTTATPLFTWTSVASTSGYRLQIADSSDFTNKLVDQSLGLVTSYTLPTALPYGKYYWRVLQAGETPTDIVYRTFSITTTPLAAPVLSASSVARVNNSSTVALAWNAVNGAAAYRVQVDNSNLFNTVLEYAWQGTNTQITTSTLVDGVYYFRVRTINSYDAPGPWSVTRIFSVDTLGPLPPVITAPVAGAVFTNGRPSLAWNASAGAAKYQVVIDTDTNCDATPTGWLTTLTYVPPTMLAQGSYYWCVRAVDAAGNQGTWGPARRMNINILSLPADGAVIISGAAKTQPTLTWIAVTGATGYTVQIDDEPSFTDATNVSLGKVTSYKITPGLDYGTYYWQVIPNTVPQAVPVYRRFTITPSLLLAPVSSATSVKALNNTSTVALAWNVVNGASAYQVQVDNSNLFNTVLEYTWQGTNTQVTTSTLADGVYYFRVRTINSYDAPGPWSVTRIFSVDTLGPLPPVITAPVAGAVFTNGRPSLAWNASAGAAKYQVVIDTDTNCDATPTGLLITLAYTPPTVLAQGSYYWCVRAVDAAGNLGMWGPARRLNINILSSPADGAVIISAVAKTQPSLTWIAVTGATGYTVQIDDEPTFTDATNVSLGKVTSYKVIPGLNYGTYYWQVIPNTVPQAVPVYRRFTITPSLLPAPVLSATSVKALNGTSTVALAWNVVNGAAAYQIQVDNSNLFNTVLEYTWQGTNTQVTTSTLADGVYYFRVRTINSYGAAGAWTVARTFTVDTTPPVLPVLTAPINTLVITNTRVPTFSWKPSPTATSYVLEIATDSNFNNSILSYNVTVVSSTTITFTLPTALALPNGTYYWRVRARDSAGNMGTPSTASQFVIGVP